MFLFISFREGLVKDKCGSEGTHNQKQLLAVLGRTEVLGGCHRIIHVELSSQNHHILNNIQ